MCFIFDAKIVLALGVFLMMVFMPFEAEAMELPNRVSMYLGDNAFSAIFIIENMLYILGVFMVGVGVIKVWRHFGRRAVEGKNALLVGVLVCDVRQGGFFGATKYLFLGGLLWAMPLAVEMTMDVLYPPYETTGCFFGDWDY